MTLSKKIEGLGKPTIGLTAEHGILERIQRRKGEAVTEESKMKCSIEVVEVAAVQVGFLDWVKHEADGSLQSNFGHACNP